MAEQRRTSTPERVGGGESTSPGRTRHRRSSTSETFGSRFFRSNGSWSASAPRSVPRATSLYARPLGCVFAGLFLLTIQG